MVHRPADSRLLSNLLQQEKDYLKQFNQLFTSSAASLDSFTAYAAASPPPASQVILAVAGLLAAADDALKRYALGVEQWREAMRVLKDMEDDVGNIMRDREILVTRLIKVSKSHKSNSGTFRESLLIGSSRHSSSSLSLSITNQDYSPSTSRPVSTSFTTSTKLAAAQSELQACETHLASKESELALRRSAAVREGLATRAKAMIQCSRVWERIGKEILDSLDDLGIIDAHRNGLLEQRPPTPRDQMPVAGPSSDFSSIGPSQSASQISYPFPEPVTNNAGPEILIQQPTPTAMPRRHSVASVSSAPSSLYHAPGTQTTYKVETVTYAPAVSLVVPPPPSSENIPLTSNDSSSFGIGLPPPIGYASETEVHTTMYIPPAHAISENEMPTAKVAAESGGSGSGGSATLMGWRHSRAESVKSQEELAYSSSGHHQPRGRVSSLGASAPAPESTSGPPITTLSHHHHTSSNINRGVGGEQKAVPITAVGSALIEVFDEPEDIEEDEDEDEEEEDDDDELPVEGEDQLIEQGKLAVVENPRFMSEERKNELEKEREKWMKQPSSDAEKGQQKSEELEPELVPVPEPVPEPEPEAKKNFSFLPQRKGAGTQDRVTFAPAVTPSTPKSSPSKGGETLPYTSPSKTSPSKRFLGSLKGFFGGSRASPEVAPSSQVQNSSSSPSPPSRFRSEPPLTPFPVVDLNAYHDSDDDDDDDDEYPTTTKTRNGFQTFLWGNGGGGALKKKKDGGSSSATAAGAGTRWSTRTDRNIRKLTKNGGGGGDEDDGEYGTYLSRDIRNNGVAGDIVGKAGLVDGTGPREVKKKRSIGTAGPGGGSPVNGGGGGGGGRKKLKKSVPPPIVTAAPPPSSLRHVISSTPQWNDTTTTVTRDQAHAPANPSTALRKSSVKTGDAPKRRSASVDESVRRGRTSNVVGEVGQTSSAGGVVDLGRKRRVSSYVIPSTNAPPVVGAAFARGIPAATRTPAVAAGTSAVSKGYSSDTAAARVARAPPTVVAPPPPAATATPSKPTRQPSAGKTQTHPQTLTNPPPTVVENTGSSRPQPHVLQPSQPQPQPQPQPHRQHSTSSSGGAAIVLTAGATQPTGTLISRPGWDAQALPTGGGLSRNNSVLSGVSGVAGGSSGGGGGAGGMSKKKKQRQTSLGHGMGSGTSLGRRSSLGSSSGHGGGGGRPAVQPTPPAQSLMSIIEDVAKHNREWNQESSQLHKNRNRIVSGGGGGGLLEREKKTGPVVGMVDVVKAPRSFGRDELAHLDPAMIKARVMETSTTTTTTTMTTLTPAPAAASGASGSGGRMVDIKAPGSIFDQRDTTAGVGSAPAAVRPKVYRQVSNSTPELTQRQQQVNLARRPSGTTLGPAATSTPVSRSKRPAKSPLRSAMKNPSRTPSPLTSPFLVHKQQQAIQEGSRPVVDGLLAPVAVPHAQYSTVLGSQQQSSSHTPSTTAPADIQSTTTMVNGRAASDSASQRRKGKRQVRSAPDEVVGEEAGESTSTNDSENEVFYTDDEDDHDHAVVVSSTGNQGATPMLNGHAVGYTGSSDLSHSTTSTAVHRLPAPTTTSPNTIQPTATLVARRRKSVRVSLQPTFSPSPPAVEYDKEEQPWVWKQDHHHHHHHTEGGGGGGQHQQQLHVHAPVPVAASSSLLLNPAHHNHHRQQKVPEPAHDIWEDSDEDVEYQNAKLLLTRAAKKEKDMNVIAARSRS